MLKYAIIKPKRYFYENIHKADTQRLTLNAYSLNDFKMLH